MPFQSSVIRQAPAPTASKTRVGGEKPNLAMLSRLTFSVARLEQKNALCRLVPTWPTRITLAGTCFEFPAGAAQQETFGRHLPRSLQEKGIDAGFAIRQPVGQKSEIRFKPLDRLHRKMVLGIERIVDRHAASGAKREIGLYDRIAAAIGEYRVIARNCAAQVVERIGRHLLQRRRRIDIPVDPPSPARHLDDGGFEFLVEHADAACLDQKVG